MQTTTLTFVGRNPKNISGRSSKFYTVAVAGNTVIINHGRIGSEGNHITKPFKSKELAAAFARERLAAKRAGGYR